MSIEAHEVTQLVRQVVEQPDAVEILRRKGPRVVARCPRPSGSVIVKLWSAASFRARVAALLRLSPYDHEWQSLVRARELGVRAPEPLGFARRIRVGGFRGGAIVMQDLGQCEPAIGLLKELVENGDEDGLARFDRAVVEMTRSMIAGNLLDDDHGVLNIVSTPTRELFRLDLERGRRVFDHRLRPRLCGVMLGRLITTYTFGAQPEVEHVRRFALLLKEQLNPSATAWERARRYLEYHLRHQLEHGGYFADVVLP